MLIKKFKINEAKIKLAYYGFRDPKIKKKKIIKIYRWVNSKVRVCKRCPLIY